MSDERAATMSEAEAGECASWGSESGFGALRCARGALPLEELEVRAEAQGAIAHLEVAQLFVNPFDEPIEATYLFPLPANAAVTRFELAVAGRQVHGVLEERGQAREDYDRAIAEGRRAAIAEKERPEIFTLRVGNLMPREHARVRLSLVAELPQRAGEVTFRFPLVVAPRYVPGAPLPGASVGSGTESDTDAVPDASRVSPPVLLPGFASAVRLKVELALEAGALEVKSLRTSLPASIERRGGRLVARLAPGERLDRDFIARWEIGPSAARTALFFAPDGDGEGTFQLFAAAPEASARRPASDLLFVLDRSGSMQGWKIAAARRALSKLVNALGPDDRFQIIAFSNEHTAFARELIAATAQARRQADEFLNRIDADGGTEMLAPLELAARLLADGDRQRARTLVLITDGQIADEARLQRTLAPLLKDVRIVALGIDQAVNAGLLQALADQSGGLFEQVESESRLDEAFARIEQMLGGAALTDLAIEIEGATIVPGSLVPTRMPSLFPGVTASVLGRFRGAPTRARVSARGARDDGWSDAALPTLAERQTLAPLWALKRLQALDLRYLAGGPGRDSIERELVQTSLRFGVLCRFTAFVAIDREERVTSGAEPHRITQPVEQPAGWVLKGDAPVVAEGGPSLVARTRYTQRVTQTQAGVLKGKFCFLAPEQARGLPLDPRADVFVLATVLYQLLTGKRLFGGESDFAILEALSQVRVPKPLFDDPALQPLEAILLRALAKEPSQRLDAATFAHELKALRESGRLGAQVELSAWLDQHFGERRVQEDERLRNPPPTAKAYGPFELVHRLNIGGYTETWLARFLENGAWRPVTVSFLLAFVSDDPEVVEGFLSELRLVHPGVVEILEAANTGDGRRPVVVREYVHGLDLQRLIGQAPTGLPPTLAVNIAERIADTLAHLHALKDSAGRALGYVYRELEPSKILVSYGGDVKLCDLGPALAKELLAPRRVHVLRALDAPAIAAAAAPATPTPPAPKRKSRLAFWK